MITAVIDAGQHYCQAVSDLWQWDYGQTLRIQGVKLPAAVEVQFSTTERIGETVTRIGVTQEGVTEVPIPDTLLEGGGTTQDYTIYAFVYIENGDSGKTEYRVSMKVRARPKPEAHATPEEGELFRQAIVAVAESADRAESARKSAETAADKAESAKNAAEAAAGSAQASADEAKTAKENAETAVKNAEAFKTETETARSEAVRAATESTDAKDSAEKSRAAAEKAKQDAEAAKAAADADKEAAEAAQAKAEAAQKAAENAETEAKKAQTATETARRETETAKAAVETMQSTVAGYADNAKNAKEAAETAKAEAETAKNDAAQAKEAAEKAKSGTAADREVTEAASKAAQVSAVSAEKSAERAETAKEEIQESADQIQKNTEDIAGLEETVSTAGISVTEAGTEIVVPECTGGKFQGLKLYGKSEQKQYQGTNLLDLRNGKNGTGEGVTYTKNEDGSYKRTGTATGVNANVWFAGGYYKDAETATVLFTLKAGKYVTRDCVLYHGTDSCSGNITINNDLTITGVRNPGQTVEKTYNDTIYPRINAGSTDTGWEPYTGGMPSPSPNYPQEINIIGNNNAINVTLHGKNLWKPYVGGFISNTDGQVTYGDIKFMAATDFIETAGKDITIIASDFKKSIECSYSFRVGFYDSDKKWIKNIAIYSNKEIHINDYEVKPAFIRVSAPAAIYDTLQIEYGSIANAYEPYHDPQTMAILTPNGLPSIPVSSGGNYTDSSGQEWICDEIDFERGMYIQRVGTKVGFDGFQETNSANSDMSLRIVCNMNDIEKVKFTPIICNKLRLEKKNSYTDEGTYISTSETDTGRVCVRVEGIKTMEEYQEILADMQYFYILATPIETPLTAEEINAYKSLYTYDGTTIIDNDAGCYMEATVPQDTKYYIDSKIAELSAAIVASASEAE